MTGQLRLRDLRDLSLVVVHPPDHDGRAIMEQLNRIGCRSDLIWPPRKSMPEGVDVVFAGLYFEARDELSQMLRRVGKQGPAIIGVADYENPIMLEFVLEIGAVAVLSKPVRSFGLLTTLTLARSNWQRLRHAESQVSKLEKRLTSQRKVEKAKAILMEMHRISGTNAYKIIRDRAMSKRIAVEDIAESIINAHELLSQTPDDVHPDPTSGQ